MMEEDEILKQLLNLAEQPSKPSDTVPLNLVEAWIIAKDIKPGTAVLTPPHLFYEFSKWNKDKSFTRYKFYVAFSKYFKVTGQMSGVCAKHYKLDPTPFDMSLNTHFLISKQLREERKKRIKHVRKVQ